MERPGEKLKQARLRLKLTYRDVEMASQKIAARRNNLSFVIALSRLADIENKGTLPSIYRVYTLSAIYRLDFDEVLNWYGIPRNSLAGDALQVRHGQTHAVRLASGDPGAAAKDEIRPAEDARQTTFIGALSRNADNLPLQILSGFDARRHRYGLIGADDWSMYPVLHPGCLVLIDDRRRKIATSGWNNEYDRPIYFLEHRAGFYCGWCIIEDDQLILLTHPASRQQPRVFSVSEIDVLGQVVGVAMTLAPAGRRSARTAIIPVPSPDR
jgi:transcriptional regulator with XRE-family HTH domain